MGGQVMTKGTSIHAPDMLDVFNIVCSLGDEYGLTVQFQTTLTLDAVQVIGRAYKHAGTVDPILQYQALVKKPLRNTREVVPLMFTVVFDLWCQAEGMGSAAAQRGAPIGWNGRPQVRRRRP